MTTVVVTRVGHATGITYTIQQALDLFGEAALLDMTQHRDAYMLADVFSAEASALFPETINELRALSCGY